jgi:hypothetical protein
VSSVRYELGLYIPEDDILLGSDLAAQTQNLDPRRKERGEHGHEELQPEHTANVLDGRNKEKSVCPRMRSNFMNKTVAGTWNSSHK